MPPVPSAEPSLGPFDAGHRRVELIERAPGPLRARADTGHRGAGIRTRDLLLPKQARYRTAPHPVNCAVKIP